MANVVVVKISLTDGKVAIYNAQGCVDVLADVVGWYNSRRNRTVAPTRRRQKRGMTVR